MAPTDLRKLLNAFNGQRGNARARGIVFSISFEEWLEVWIASGHLHERGRGKYVMARDGDRGPYAIGNVKIISHSENIREAYLNKTDEEMDRWKSGMKKGGRGNAGNLRPDLADLNRSRRGQPRSPESVEKTRQKQIGSKRSAETRAKMSASAKAARARKFWISRGVPRDQ